LAKIRRRYFVGAKVFDIFSMAGRYNKPVQYGRESAHKSRAAGGNALLDDCMHGEQHHSGRSRRSSVGPERSQQLRILPSLTVRRFSCVCAIFSVCANILPMPSFCRRLYFVDAYIFCRTTILSTPILHIFLSTPIILSTRIFLSTPIILLTRIFLLTPIILSTCIFLPAPIFCHRQV
jgi:hypothetical protein